MKRVLRSLALAITCTLGAACAVDGAPAPIASPRPATGPEGTSIASGEKNPIPYQQLWDPCTLKPEYFDILDQGRFSDASPLSRQSLMKSCGFRGPYRTTSYAEGMKKLPSFTIGVASFVTSFDEAFTNTANEAIKPTTVSGRKAHLFGNRPLPVDESCSIVWGTSFGSIWVMATLVGQDPPPSAIPICHRAAEIVWQHAPR